MRRIGWLAMVAGMMGCAAGGDPGVATEAHGPKPPDENGVVGCWVTGGGQVDAVNGLFAGGAFGFNAMSMRNGTYRGRLNHVSFDGDHFRGRTVDGIECEVVDDQQPDPPDADPVIARWWGEGIFNDDPDCYYEVEVEDHGEPALDGAPDDSYRLTVMCGGELVYVVDNTIARGNIQIHPPNPGHPDLTGTGFGI